MEAEEEAEEAEEAEEKVAAVTFDRPANVSIT